jgi:hypothetical protein
MKIYVAAVEALKKKERRHVKFQFGRTANFGLNWWQIPKRGLIAYTISCQFYPFHSTLLR